MLRVLLCSALATAASGFLAGAPQCPARGRRGAASAVRMINLFGNNEESNQRRSDLSLRSAPVGSRKVQFRKPNSATQGIMLGLKFRDTFGKGVIIDKIIDGTEAARLKRDGKIKEGDEIVMVSATFGDEMWSARGIGKMRLEKSIAVRQGMTISFVVEGKDDNSERRKKQMSAAQSKEKERMGRLQKQLSAEVEAEKKKPKLFGLF